MSEEQTCGNCTAWNFTIPLPNPIWATCTFQGKPGYGFSVALCEAENCDAFLETNRYFSCNAWQPQPATGRS